MIDELALIRRGFVDRLARLRRIAARATGWPLLVRAVVYVAALAAIALAFPASVLSGNGLPVLGVLAALPALWPRTFAVSGYCLLTVLGWVAATTAYGEPAGPWRLAAVAAGLYVVHSGAALAAVLPFDAVVEPGVLARWLLRAVPVVAISTLLAVVGVPFAAVPAERRGYLVASFVGLALMVALAGLLVYGWRRRSQPPLM
jgi:hypothetical protein